MAITHLHWLLKNKVLQGLLNPKGAFVCPRTSIQSSSPQPFARREFEGMHRGASFISEKGHYAPNPAPLHVGPTKFVCC